MPVCICFVHSSSSSVNITTSRTTHIRIRSLSVKLNFSCLLRFSFVIVVVRIPSVIYSMLCFYLRQKNVIEFFSVLCFEMFRSVVVMSLKFNCYLIECLWNSSQLTQRQRHSHIISFILSLAFERQYTNRLFSFIRCRWRVTSFLSHCRWFFIKMVDAAVIVASWRHYYELFLQKDPTQINSKEKASKMIPHRSLMY